MEMPRIDREIMEEALSYEGRYYTYDLPVPFCGLKLYPITMRNYEEFLSCNCCFLLNKNDDPKGLGKSHLDYLLLKLTEDEQKQIWSLKFSRLMELIFRIENGLRCPKCGKIMTFEEFLRKYEEITKEGKLTEQILQCDCGEILQERILFKPNEKTKKNSLWIDGKEITSKDFNRLRRIVLYQNLPDYQDDSFVDRDLREDQAKKHQILSKDSGTASTEKKLICVASQTSYKIHELYDLPIRKFLILLSTVDDVISYTTARMGMMTGMVSFKEPPEHWIYKKKKELYDTAVDAQSFKNSIAKANGG